MYNQYSVVVQSGAHSENIILLDVSILQTKIIVSLFYYIFNIHIFNIHF